MYSTRRKALFPAASPISTTAHALRCGAWPHFLRLMQQPPRLPTPPILCGFPQAFAAKLPTPHDFPPMPGQGDSAPFCFHPTLQRLRKMTPSTTAPNLLRQLLVHQQSLLPHAHHGPANLPRQLACLPRGPSPLTNTVPQQTFLPLQPHLPATV